jgi:hypothetical protein
LSVENDLRHLRGSFIPDGESIGDDYHVFDLLEHNGDNLRPLPYRIRLVRLVDVLLSTANHPHVRLVETAFTTVQKTELWERLRRENREGIVFKRLDAPYTPGKPNSGGPQLKFKFVATLSGGRQDQRPAQRGGESVQRAEFGFVWQCDHPGQSSNSIGWCHCGGALPLRLPG